FPGSHVDVLVTLRSDYNSANAATRTVLQDVQVLSTGTKIDPDPDGKPENVAVVTLLVTPEQSEKLALAQNQVAQNQGTIHFVLRNNGDSAKPDTPAVGMAQLTGTPEMSATSHSKHAVALKPAAAYIVETLMGNKVTIAKFPATPE
ncbi:MAG: Flp pilus assembly protein CpaB, partial [Acidobacteria bacterium]